jgi:putative FmdB family regulatory protein
VPTYQYACTECGHGFDQVQSFSDPALTVCPECGGQLRKVFSAAGVVFKGSGFYRTDSRSTSSSSSSGSSSSSAGSSGSSSSSSGSSSSSD